MVDHTNSLSISETDSVGIPVQVLVCLDKLRYVLEEAAEFVGFESKNNKISVTIKFLREKSSHEQPKSNQLKTDPIAPKRRSPNPT